MGQLLVFAEERFSVSFLSNQFLSKLPTVFIENYS